MPETEADRIMRERARQRELAADAEAERQNDALLKTLHWLVRESEEEIATILRLAGTQGYPDILEVTIPKNVTRLKRWFTGGPQVEEEIKAAWQIGTFRYRSYDETKTAILYLLSDGRVWDGWAFLGTPETPREFASTTLHLDIPKVRMEIALAIEVGIRALRKKLEARQSSS